MSAFRGLENESGRTILNLLKFFDELLGHFDKRELQLTIRDNTRDVTRVLVASTVRTCLNELILCSFR